MKNIKFLKFVFLLTITFTACSDDEGIEIIEPNHRAIVTSEMNFQNKVNPGGHIDFGDISRGVSSRTWTFPEGSVISGESGNTSSKEVVKGVFNTVGEHNVTLHQVFKGNAYPNDDSTSPAGKELDTTIVVTVLSEVNITSLQAFTINNDGTTGAELNMANNAKNEVLAGSSVRYVVSTEGEPENYDWQIDGGDSGDAETFVDEFDVKYKKLGTYNFGFAANRSRPDGTDAISFSNLITVIPSTEPVTLDEVTDRDGSIALVFSREMATAGLNAEDFMISLFNGETEIPVTIANVTTDPEEENIVLISLEGDRIYNNDQVTVSYTGTSMTTTDLVASETFDNEPLMFNLINLNESAGWDSGFENSALSNWPYLNWGGVWEKFNHEISTAQPRSNATSLKVEFEAQGGMIIGHKDNTGTDVMVSVEEGKSYEVGYWLYVETLGYNLEGDMFDSDIRFYPSNWAFELIPTTFNAEMPTGEWVYQKQSFTAGFSGDVTWFIRGFNEHNTEAITFYIDDMVFAEVVLRP